MHDIFYFTDIHGNGALFDAIMNYCHEQDDEAMIIFGGDACDRGKEGYRIMKALLEHPQVTYLKGNHEDMFVKAAQEIKHFFNFEGSDKETIHNVLNACRYYDYKYASIQDSLYNGGLDTLTDWIMDGMSMEFVDRIAALPLTFSYNHVDFCHASPIYKAFKEANDTEYEGGQVDEWSAGYLLWSRNALDAPWAPNRILICGHTPVPYLTDYIRDMKLDKNKDVQPVKWGDPAVTGEKLDMDTGAAFLGRAYVLNVLTMQAQGFEDKDAKNDEIHQHDIEQIEMIQF